MAEIPNNHLLDVQNIVNNGKNYLFLNLWLAGFLNHQQKPTLTTKLRSYHWNLQWFHPQILSKFDDLRNVTSSKHCGHRAEVLQHVLEIVHRSWKSESEWCSLLWANHWIDWFSRPCSSVHGLCMYNKHPIQPGLEATLGHPSKGCKIEIAHLPVLAPGVSGKTQRNVRIQHSSYCFTRNLPINHLMLSCPIFSLSQLFGKLPTP